MPLMPPLYRGAPLTPYIGGGARRATGRRQHPLTGRCTPFTYPPLKGLAKRLGFCATLIFISPANGSAPELTLHPSPYAQLIVSRALSHAAAPRGVWYRRWRLHPFFLPRQRQRAGAHRDLTPFPLFPRYPLTYPFHSQLRPAGSGIGGGAFILISPANGSAPELIDARETAPAGATETMFVGRMSAAQASLVPLESFILFYICLFLLALFTIGGCSRA